MGLDQFMKVANKDDFVSDTEFKEDFQGGKEFWYWRKNNALHGYMQKLYVAKGGDPNPNEFNCVPVVLTFEDIKKLRNSISEDKLQPTSGFFFGSLSYEEEEKEDDLKFCNEATLWYLQKLNEADCMLLQILKCQN
jgi:hypothetical protein